MKCDMCGRGIKTRAYNATTSGDAVINYSRPIGEKRYNLRFGLGSGHGLNSVGKDDAVCWPCMKDLVRKAIDFLDDEQPAAKAGA